MSSENKVFDLLEADGDDIEALTAYALYKRHKRAWAKDFEKEKGHKPSQEDDVAFAKVVSTEDQLQRYKKDAQDILIAFANQTVDEARPEIEQGAITARIERAATDISSQATFRSQVVSGIVSTAINTLVLILLVVGVRLIGVDLITALQSIEPIIEAKP